MNAIMVEQLASDRQHDYLREREADRIAGQVGVPTTRRVLGLALVRLGRHLVGLGDVWLGAGREVSPSVRRV